MQLEQSWHAPIMACILEIGERLTFPDHMAACSHPNWEGKMAGEAVDRQSTIPAINNSEISFKKKSSFLFLFKDIDKGTNTIEQVLGGIYLFIFNVCAYCVV